MIKAVRFLLFSIVFVAGLLTIIATPGEIHNPLIFYVVTQNNYEDEPFGYRQAFACKGEEALLKWRDLSSSDPRLSAEPVNSISPELQNKAIMKSGSLNITVLDEAELILDLSDGDPALKLGLVPEKLCAAHAFPLIGWYEGQFEQALPVTSSFERQLRLIWTDEESPAPFLRAKLADNLSNPSFIERLKCDYTLASANLVCVGESDKTLRLELTVTADGLSGTYSGRTTTEFDFEGELVMKKQTDAPTLTIHEAPIESPQTR